MANQQRPDHPWDTDDIDDLPGVVVVVTGANSGLGLSSALALARHGATVVMACRDPERSRSAHEDVSRAATGADPVLVTLDLADLESVEAAVEPIEAASGRVDVLINNAGVMATR